MASQPCHHAGEVAAHLKDLVAFPKIKAGTPTFYFPFAFWWKTILYAAVLTNTMSHSTQLR